MTILNLDTLATEVLAARDSYTSEEWIWIVALAVVFVEEARRLGVDPCERAGERIRAVERSMSMGAPDAADLAHSDVVIAAALVYLGRIS